MRFPERRRLALKRFKRRHRAFNEQRHKSRQRTGSLYPAIVRGNSAERHENNVKPRTVASRRQGDRLPTQTVPKRIAVRDARHHGLNAWWPAVTSIVKVRRSDRCSQPTPSAPTYTQRSSHLLSLTELFVDAVFAVLAATARFSTFGSMRNHSSLQRRPVPNLRSSRKLPEGDLAVTAQAFGKVVPSTTV